MVDGLRVAQHLERAQRHRTVGSALADAGDEWAAVCFFYSAYHVIRHALRTDPVFDDPSALTRIRADFYPALRDVERHHGRRGGAQREYGVNDLVLHLYRPVIGAYDRLHLDSIAVRYGAGMIGKPLERVSRQLDEIWAAHDGGQLRYGA